MSNLITAKLHFRKLKNGGYFVQGAVLDDAQELPFNDQLCVASIIIENLEDRTEQYSGKSNDVIKREGFV